ncbi:MAG: hypothetical protein GC137_04085 [Alphaproteobacteria bacterium]|nr:hypothetical protein [Alphaproteobacteria bacterium]
MTKPSFNRFVTLTAFMSVVFLGACEISAFKAVTAGVAAVSGGVFSNPDVNLKEKNYAAADFLASKIQDRIGPFAIIRAEPLQEADHIGITSPLGRAIPEGVGLRLADLGYRVQLHNVIPKENVALYPAPTSEAHYVLSGVYAVKKKHVDVILQVVDAKTGHSVGRFDYDLLLSSEVRHMAETEPSIVKVK